MDGVVALRSVLIADAALLAIVPAERIVAGTLPLDAALSAIAITSVSKVDDNLLSPETTRFVRERVQVMALAATYPELKRVLRAVRHAAADQIDPVVDGLTGVTILTAGAGPDLMDEQASIYQGTQDFSVSYNEER